VIDRHDISARCLRLVLALLVDQHDRDRAFATTLAEFDDASREEIRFALSVLTNLAGGALLARVEGDVAAATAFVEQYIAAMLDQRGTAS
jgi:hypothetical protein